MGTLTLTAWYLTTPSFLLDEMDNILSSRFFEGGVGGCAGVYAYACWEEQGMGMGTSPLGSSPIRTSILTAETGFAF
jgi:hypothetical protein